MTMRCDECKFWKDCKARWPRLLAESDPVVRSVLERSLGRDPGEWGDPLDPYTGFGFTAPGPRLPGGQITLNQELILNDAPVPVGSQIFHQGPDGRSVPIATLVAGSDGGVHWAVSPDCPPELAPRFQQLAAQGQVNAQSAR